MDKGVWWLVLEGTEPVGFACFLPTKANPEWGYLARAGVLPEARGHGLQRKLIRVREAYAKRSGYKVIVTDTANLNVASSNSLIACGYRLYTPHTRWGFASGNYWRKTL